MKTDRRKQNTCLVIMLAEAKTLLHYFLVRYIFFKRCTIVNDVRHYEQKSTD